MDACLARPPECDPTLGGCGTWAALPYFITFNLSVTTIMINLFTAVIIESFERQNSGEEDSLSPQSINEFMSLWSEYDQGGSGYLDIAEFLKLLI